MYKYIQRAYCIFCQAAIKKYNENKNFNKCPVLPDGILVAGTQYNSWGQQK